MCMLRAPYRCRFTDLEVENVLKKHGIEPENTLSEDQAREVFRDALYDRSGSGNDNPFCIFDGNRLIGQHYAQI